MHVNYDNRIFGLDIMRATAILFVVVSHLLWIYPEASGAFADLASLAGVMGVEIFFVLSGFLIGRILFRVFTKEKYSNKDLYYFLIRRWFRTLPNYYLVLLLNIGILFWFERDLPETLLSYFFFLQNAVSGMDIFFTESWSLPIEEFAYILGPLLFYIALMVLPGRPKRSLFLLVTLLVIAFFLVTKIVYNYTNAPHDILQWNVELKAVLLYRIDAIFYGILAAYISMTNAELWNRRPEVMLFAGFFFFCMLQFSVAYFGISVEAYPFFWNVLYLPLSSVCIAFSLPFFSAMKTGLRAVVVPVTFISIVSYAMYLLHYSIILQLMRYFCPIEGLDLTDKFVFSSVYLMLTMAFSYLLYRFYEKPLMDIRDKPYFTRRFSKM